MNIQQIYQTSKELFNRELYSSVVDLIELSLPLDSLDRLNAYHHQCMLLKGEACFRLNQLEKAKACYSEALGLLSSKSLNDTPTGSLLKGFESVRVHNRNYFHSKIARCMLGLKDYEGAQEELKKIHTQHLDSTTKLIWLKVGKVMDNPIAYRCGKELLKESPCALEIIDEMLEMDDTSLEDLLHPSQPDWLKTYIRFKYHSVRLHQEAAQAEMVTLDNILAPNAKINGEEADMFYRQGEFSRALVHFKQAYKEDPYSDRLFGKYVNALAALGKLNSLESVVMKRAGGAFPRSSQTLHGLSRIWELNGNIEGAEILCQKGSFRLALGDFQVALSMQKNILVYEGFVHAACKLKDYGVARVVAGNCIKNMPVNYRSHMLMGKVYFFERKAIKEHAGKAVECFKQAAKLAPTCSTPILWMALIERNLCDLEAAKKLIQGFLSHNSCAVATAQLGFLLLLAKEFDTAINYFEKAIRIQRNLRIAREGKRMALAQKAGQYTDAPSTAEAIFNLKLAGIMDPLFEPWFDAPWST
ncbi:Anaphase promoting complex subunit 7 [Entomophthora muscae]|uniref:Anaphase promoting complex subunit 7 n=1 Tax=Entomophthora muscae TaxID=34485 RepID=A0ACC2RWW1_9FUNG|nr:Anaphase promoting complex subunit 7 [Entomophthora muscae]